MWRFLYSTSYWWCSQTTKHGTQEICWSWKVIWCFTWKPSYSKAKGTIKYLLNNSCSSDFYVYEEDVTQDSREAETEESLDTATGAETDPTEADTKEPLDPITEAAYNENVAQEADFREAETEESLDRTIGTKTNPKKVKTEKSLDTVMEAAGKDNLTQEADLREAETEKSNYSAKGAAGKENVTQEADSREAATNIILDTTTEAASKKNIIQKADSEEAETEETIDTTVGVETHPKEAKSEQSIDTTIEADESTNTVTIREGDIDITTRNLNQQGKQSKQLYFTIWFIYKIYMIQFVGSI